MNTLKILAVAFACVVSRPLSAAARTVFTDAQIAGIVGAANQDELDAAALAVDKTQDADVKAFAERMTKDHGGAKLKLADLEAKTGSVPGVTAVSDDLTKHGSDELAQLGALTGAAFDRAYIDAEVSDHAALLKKFNEDLIPDAKNPSLAALLRKLRPVIASHLAKARRLRARFKD